VDWGTDRLAGRLEAYGRQTLRELDATADLIGSLYANMSDFESFKSLSMLYFAAAMTAETRRRIGTSKTQHGFLLENDPTFGPVLRDCLRLSHNDGSTSARTNCNDTIRQAIEPINLAHLGDSARRNWYPCLADDLFEAAPKLGATKTDIERLLARCGFSSKV
jgi:FADH2 O2-dependent halogenase